jgi:hypothetical protein
VESSRQQLRFEARTCPDPARVRLISHLNRFQTMLLLGSKGRQEAEAAIQTKALLQQLRVWRDENAL